MKIIKRLFGNYEGQSIIEFSLHNDNGMTVSCLNYGCVITKINVPDKLGNDENVVLGFDDFNDYVKWSPYFGAVVGRVAGRIKGSQFTLDGEDYQLTINQPPNHLHGGAKGFSSIVWKYETIEEKDSVGIKFFYRSPHGEEGYPGNLEVVVTYLLNNQNQFDITFEAAADRKTIVNLTNHSYFNLSGNVKRDVLEHSIQMNCDRYLELDMQSIPTGKLLDATNTVFDFQNGKKLIEGIQSGHPQIELVGYGYDHPFVFNDRGTNKIELVDEESGRTLTVTTDQPSVVLYTGNKLEGPFSIAGVKARNYLGVCLETQGFPDAIHHSHFPSVILEPNQLNYSTTRYHFNRE